MAERLKKETKDNQLHITQGQGQIKDLWKRFAPSIWRAKPDRLEAK
ncbi:MAG: hypothetical protein HKN76_20055 [Saprospiraceae bacterium]|nr:hypothetical protein [Saprospiraceae bacterium]